MSVTIAQRPHIHLPWKTIAVILLAAAVAAAVLVLVNQPWQEQTVGGSATTATNAGQTGAVSQGKTPAMLHADFGADRSAASTTTGTSTTGLSSSPGSVRNAPPGSFIPGAKL
jgi:hypothetical protein